MIHVNIGRMKKIPDSPQRRSYGGISPEERRQQRRERLIEAGIEAFGTRGFHAVTVREICNEAQLTERYFYESFSGLEKLFAAVYARIGLELKQATLAVLGRAGAQPIELAEAALRVFFEYVRKDPRRARILLVEAVGIDADIHRLAYQAARDYTELMRGFFDVLFPEAAAAGFRPELLSAGLIGSNIHIATHWVQDGFRTPIDEVLYSAMAVYNAMNACWGGRVRKAAAKRKPGKRGR